MIQFVKKWTVIAVDTDKMFCRFCGKEILEDSAFCSYCGRQLTPKVQEQKPEEPVAESTFKEIVDKAYGGSDDISVTATNMVTNAKPKNYILRYAIFWIIIVFIFVTVFAYQSQKSSTINHPVSISDKINHAAVIAMQEVLKQQGIYKYSHLGGEYYPKHYTQKDNVHLSYSKVDFNGYDHSYCVGFTLDSEEKPVLVFVSLDDDVLLDTMNLATIS